MHLGGLKQEIPVVVKSGRCDIVMYFSIISSELLLQTCVLIKLNLSFIAAEFFLFSTYYNAYTYEFVLGGGNYAPIKMYTERIACRPVSG